MGQSRTLDHPATTQTINSSASYTSEEQDVGADTIAYQPVLYCEVDGFADAPTGTIEITVAPIHTTGGDGFDDNAVHLVAEPDADQKYQWSWGLDRLPRFYEVAVYNETDQNTDASAVDVWVEYVAVTA